MTDAGNPVNTANPANPVSKSHFDVSKNRFRDQEKANAVARFRAARPLALCAPNMVKYPPLYLKEEKETKQNRKKQ